MDQARNILNSYIPATQWAMNYLNNNITQPTLQAGGNFTKGFNELPQDVAPNAGFFESTGNSVANATPAGGMESGLLKTAHALGNTHGLPLAMGMVGKQASSFGSALRNAQKGVNIPVHPEDVKELSPIIERLLTQSQNPNYFINQLPQDHKTLGPVAEYYMPGVTQTLKNDPVQIAQALLNRIITDRKAIPN